MIFHLNCFSQASDISNLWWRHHRSKSDVDLAVQSDGGKSRAVINVDIRWKAPDGIGGRQGQVGWRRSSVEYSVRDVRWCWGLPMSGSQQRWIGLKIGGRQHLGSVILAPLPWTAVVYANLILRRFVYKQSLSCSCHWFRYANQASNYRAG